MARWAGCPSDSAAARTATPSPRGPRARRASTPRTKDLTKRLRPGDIAVIDHQDIDKVSAEALAGLPARGRRQRRALDLRALPEPRARRSSSTPASRCSTTSGRTSCTTCTEGSRSASTATTSVRRRRRSSPTGTALDHDIVAGCDDRGPGRARRPARGVRGQHDGVPAARARPAARRRRRPRHHDRPRRPARPHRRARLPLQGGPADAAAATSASTARSSSASTAAPTRCVEAGHKPDLIVGDMDSVSDATLRCGAEIVVHAYRDGRAPGLERVRALGVEPVVFPATGTSEDVAMLLADDKGADAHRRRRHPRHPRRVPRQGPLRHGQHLPHPAAGRRQARRRQGRQPALPLADLQPRAWPLMLLVGLFALCRRPLVHDGRHAPSSRCSAPAGTTCGPPS